MEVVHFLIDFILNIDKHLLAFVSQYGTLVYGLLFLIIFVETGLVFMPFLPGDSLLFVTGALAAQGAISYAGVVFLLFVAAFAGDQLNYIIGKYFGQHFLNRGDTWWFKRKYFDATQAFYQRHGPIAIVLARFFPFLRTFAPFVAGAVHMSYRVFLWYNFLGALIWVVSVVTLGYIFGNVPWVSDNLKWIIWGLILVPGVLVLVKAALIGLRKKNNNPNT